MRTRPRRLSSEPEARRRELLEQLERRGDPEWQAFAARALAPLGGPRKLPKHVAELALPKIRKVGDVAGALAPLEVRHARDVRGRGVTLQLERVLCGKPRCDKLHGPYWYAYWTSQSRTRKRYIGRGLEDLARLDLEAERVGKLERARAARRAGP